MRLGVLDVGSNTIHLQVMDAHPGARPTPTTNYKVELRLTEYLDISGAISAGGIQLLNDAIKEAVAHARVNETDEILAFATSALREASNGTQIIADINKKHEIDLQVLNGDDEASMTFLAVRRWLGWSAGKLLVIDIGGGSLEIASGINENPDATISLPLGAARLTREFLNGDPYSAKGIKGLEKHAEEVLRDSMPNSLKSHDADHFVATSKTFRTLARICAQWYGDDPKFIERKSLNSAMPRLIEMNSKSRAELPGVSANRAQQIVAGGIVALAVMDRLDVDEAEICPWALREGILLRRLDWLSD
jgi:exopolyphosphatase/guanosine-5'-triphosphate,3'-diphosphate pyrophosphatase